MKKLMYKISFLLVGVLMFSSCEQNEIPIYDSQNGRALASFNGLDNQSVTFDPSTDTENVITIGVSTVSDQDRTVNISVVDSTTTLDPSYYTISTLMPVIKAGEYTTDITVTTIASENVPASGSTLTLNLDSVDGAEVLGSSTASLGLGVNVKCPSVDLAAITGEGNVSSNELSTDAFGVSIADGGATRTVTAGPGENQITIVGGIGPILGSEDLILNVDPDSGNVSYGGSPDAIFFLNEDDPIAYTAVSGNVLTCIGQINLEIAAPFGSPFNSNTFKLQF